MPIIRATTVEVFSRGKEIRRLLRPIASTYSNGPAWAHKPVGQSIIIGTHDGSSITSDYRDWRFSTFVPKTRASYFEKWDRFDDDLFFLNRAYLHIYLYDTTTSYENELILLHCDPNEAGDTNKTTYKKGPHLHIVAAEYPIPKAHIPLNMIHIHAILNSAQNLLDAMAAAVVLIKEEVLDRLY